MNSGFQVAATTTIRVTSDQHAIVISQPMSELFMNPEKGLLYLMDKVQSAMPYLDTDEKFFTFLETHPRFIAAAKTVKRIRTSQAIPTAETVMTELRIPVDQGVKLSFDIVTREEDNYCYGVDFVQDASTRETHFFIIELKEEKTDGFGSPKPTGIYQMRTPGMDSIPEEVSIRSHDAGSTYSRRTTATSSVTRGSARACGNTPETGRGDMNVDSDDYTRTTYRLFSRIQNCEQDLMQQINNRGRDPCGLSVNSDFSDASKMKSPSKKQRPFAGGPYGEDAAFFPRTVGNLEKPPPSPALPDQQPAAQLPVAQSPARQPVQRPHVFQPAPFVTTVDSFSTANSSSVASTPVRGDSSVRTSTRTVASTRSSKRKTAAKKKCDEDSL
jgi:hypothetical protein